MTHLGAPASQHKERYPVRAHPKKEIGPPGWLVDMMDAFVAVEDATNTFLRRPRQRELTLPETGSVNQFDALMELYQELSACLDGKIPDAKIDRELFMAQFGDETDSTEAAVRSFFIGFVNAMNTAYTQESAFWKDGMLPPEKVGAILPYDVLLKEYMNGVYFTVPEIQVRNPPAKWGLRGSVASFPIGNLQHAELPHIQDPKVYDPGLGANPLLYVGNRLDSHRFFVSVARSADIANSYTHGGSNRGRNMRIHILSEQADTYPRLYSQMTYDRPEEPADTSLAHACEAYLTLIDMKDLLKKSANAPIADTTHHVILIENLEDTIDAVSKLRASDEFYKMRIRNGEIRELVDFILQAQHPTIHLMIGTADVPESSEGDQFLEKFSFRLWSTVDGLLPHQFVQVEPDGENGSRSQIYWNPEIKIIK